MKRSTLTTAVAAGVAGVAGIANISSAVNLNPDGLGQVLIYPFYTVNGGNDTLISVVNTTEEVKAVKVRFLESKNSREVLDFNLYLSPFDVWVAAATSDGADGPGRLILPKNPDGSEAETSCTVPPIPAAGVQFTNLLLSERGPIVGNALAALIDPSLERTREGYVEIIEMGVVDETADSLGGDPEGLEDAAIHDSSGVPEDCDALVEAWSTGGIWRDEPNFDVVAPTGGLFGGGSVVNVFGGYMASYTADAIGGFYLPGVAGTAATAPDIRATLHSEPGDTFPTLLQANTFELTGSNLVDRSFVFNQDVVITSDWSRAGVPDAVSAIFMRDFIYNEYAIESTVDGATEWVLTFPTKRFYVVPTDPVDSAVAGFGAAVNPFTYQFGGNTGGLGGIGGCEFVDLDFFDREEQTTFRFNEPVFSPAPPDNPNIPFLCFEAQVVTFGEPDTGFFGTNPSDILGSPNSQNVAVEAEEFESGWARIGFSPDDVGEGLGSEHFMISDDLDTYNGLPVTGFGMQLIRNNTLVDADGNNVLSNYAGLFTHRSSRSIIGS